MTYLEAVLKVLAVGLILGAGLPALFAVGLVAFANGDGGEQGGATVASRPLLKFVGLFLFAAVAAVIVIAILWITKGTIAHHFGVNPVPFLPSK